MKRALVGLLAAPLILAGCGNDFRHDQSTEEERTICVDRSSYVRQPDGMCDSGFGRWYFVPYGQWMPAVGQRVQHADRHSFRATKTVTKTPTKTATKTKTTKTKSWWQKTATPTRRTR